MTISTAIADTARQMNLPFDIDPLQRSECLSERDEKLRGPEAWDRVQQMADVEANRPDRRRVTNAKAHGVAVTAHKTIEAKTVVDVAAVIKCCATQVAYDGQGKAELRVED